MGNFQRIGSVSNSHVGSDFERTAKVVLAQQRLVVAPKFCLTVGIGSKKKKHAFDLGATSPKVIVECKSHKWTSGGNIPSAKMTVWNEAMYYFAVAPKEYRKILFVLRDYSTKRRATLAEYYMRTYEHLIPKKVEIWEYDEAKKLAKILLSFPRSCVGTSS